MQLWVKQNNNYLHLSDWRLNYMMEKLVFMLQDFQLTNSNSKNNARFDTDFNGYTIPKNILQVKAF